MTPYEIWRAVVRVLSGQATIERMFPQEQLPPVQLPPIEEPSLRAREIDYSEHERLERRHHVQELQLARLRVIAQVRGRDAY